MYKRNGRINLFIAFPEINYHDVVPINTTTNLAWITMYPTCVDLLIPSIITIKEKRKTSEERNETRTTFPVLDRTEAEIILIPRFFYEPIDRHPRSNYSVITLYYAKLRIIYYCSRWWSIMFAREASCPRPNQQESSNRISMQLRETGCQGWGSLRVRIPHGDEKGPTIPMDRPSYFASSLLPFY